MAIMDPYIADDAHYYVTCYCGRCSCKPMTMEISPKEYELMRNDKPWPIVVGHVHNV